MSHYDTIIIGVARSELRATAYLLMDDFLRS